MFASDSLIYNSSPLTVLRTNTFPGDSSSDTYSQSTTLYTSIWERTWSNRLVGFSRKAKLPKVPSLVVRQVKGPRLPFRHTKIVTKRRKVLVRLDSSVSRKANFTAGGFRTAYIYETFTKKSKKVYWKRGKIDVFRVVYSPSSQPSLPVEEYPNDLHYQKDNLKISGSTIVTESGPYGFSRSYSGDLISNWQTLSNRSVVKVPSTYSDVSSSSLVASLLAEARPIALQKLYSRISDQKVHLGNMIAESRKTADLILDLSKRLTKTIVSLVRKDFRSAASHLFPTSSKSLANDYLCFMFGLKPLQSDLAGLIQTFSEGVDFKTKASGVSSRSGEQVLYSGTNHHVKVEVKEVVSVTVKRVCQLTLSGQAERIASQFGLADLSQVAWEVTPWSFVVDWFIPVGKYIASQTVRHGIEIDDYYETVVIRRKVVASHRFLSTGSSVAGYYWNGEEVSWELEQFRCTRAVELGDALPPFPLTFDFEPVSLTHILESVALLTQASKPKR